MILKTTTWKGRNTHNLELTKSLAIEKGITTPTIINFGPGGSVDFMAKYLEEGIVSDLSLWKRFIRVFESFLRKTGLFRLITSEPREIMHVFASMLPSKLLVFDLQKKVLTAVMNLQKEKVFTMPVETKVWDVQKAPVGVEADIVIALNIVSRTSNRGRSLANVAAATKIGGLICINIDEPPAGFRQVGRCVFERVE